MMRRGVQRSTTSSRIVLAAGLAGLAPLIWQWAAFRELFWFGDEWDLLSQIEQTGFWPWLWSVFAENFVPVFKLLWGGAAQLFGGSYFAMLLLLWGTHALNTVLFGRLLLRAGFPLVATLFCQLTFGLSAVNIETLGWTVQWSAVLATTFFLLGLLALPDAASVSASHATSRRLVALVLCSAGSALSFSRGVLTGAVLALAQLWPEARLRLDLRGSAWARAALCLAPAVAAGALIAIFATGNHRSLSHHLAEASTYALWYFSLNPLHRLVAVDSWGPVTTTLLGAAKLALLVWGWRKASPGQRHLLALLLAFDLGNSVLLGIGRYHTGLETAISSRYQYGSLLAVLPFAGLVLDRLLARVPDVFRLRTVAASLLLVAAGVCFLRKWSHEAPGFAHARGTVTRNLLHHDKHPPAMGAVPGIPFLSTPRAKELMQRFNLH